MILNDASFIHRTDKAVCVRWRNKALWIPISQIVSCPQPWGLKRTDGKLSYIKPKARFDFFVLKGLVEAQYQEMAVA